jgi:Uma2 family endonuclease
MSTKLELYMKGGIDEYWIVDIDEKELSPLLVDLVACSSIGV